LEIRTYVNDEVVFLQNAPPDAYYTVLRGAVSIYALVKDVTHSAQDMVVNKRLQYGKFLVQLRNGAGEAGGEAKQGEAAVFAFSCN